MPWVPWHGMIPVKCSCQRKSRLATYQPRQRVFVTHPVLTSSVNQVEHFLLLRAHSRCSLTWCTSEPLPRPPGLPRAWQLESLAVQIEELKQRIAGLKKDARPREGEAQEAALLAREVAEKDAVLEEVVAEAAPLKTRVCGTEDGGGGGWTVGVWTDGAEHLAREGSWCRVELDRRHIDRHPLPLGHCMTMFLSLRVTVTPLPMIGDSV